MRPLRSILFLFLLSQAACQAPGIGTGTSATGTGASTTGDAGRDAVLGGVGSGDGVTEVSSAGPAGGGGDPTAGAAQPGLPSGTVAPQTDYDGGVFTLVATYDRLCNDETDGRVRIHLEGRVKGLEDTSCSFDGQRALRIVYLGPPMANPQVALRFVDAPVSGEGQVTAGVSTSSPQGMRFYMVKKGQDSVTDEESCAGDSCIDPHESCPVLTIFEGSLIENPRRQLAVPACPVVSRSSP